MTIWSSSRRLLLVQILGTATRQKYSMWQHQWPLSRMPWVGLPVETHNNVWPACFFRGQTEYRVHPARQFYHSSVSFRHTRWPLSSHLKHIFQDEEKFLPQENIQLMAPDGNEDFSKIFLAQCILELHNKPLRTSYIKCLKVCYILLLSVGRHVEIQFHCIAKWIWRASNVQEWEYP